MHRLVLTVMLCSLLSLSLLPQDPEHPRPPAPPPDAAPLVPVQQAPRTAVERKDLLQRFDEPSPLEGFYHLVEFDLDASGSPSPAEGYLAVGRDYLSIHLIAPQPGKPPAFQSAFRRYRISGETLVTTSMLGVRNEPSGKVLVEGKGLSAVRRFELVGTRLTLFGDDDRKMVFERIE